MMFVLGTIAFLAGFGILLATFLSAVFIALEEEKRSTGAG